MILYHIKWENEFIETESMRKANNHQRKECEEWEEMRSIKSFTMFTGVTVLESQQELYIE